MKMWAKLLLSIRLDLIKKSCYYKKDNVTHNYEDQSEQHSPVHTVHVM